MIPRILVVLWLLFLPHALPLSSVPLGTLDSDEEDANCTMGAAELEAMTDDELESICSERGFELIHTDADPLTHGDYVDAAQRCLAIERDMNAILEQNPDLADELVAEIDRMREEKESLVREQREMLDLKEKLEEQLLVSRAKDEGTEEPSRMWGAPSDAVPKQAEDVGNQTSTTSASEDTATATLDNSSKSTDFSLKGFLQEIMTEFEKDVHRVTSLLLPVIKPLYATGTRAWKYVKGMFQIARRQYRKYQQRYTPPHQKQKEEDRSTNEQGSTNSPLLQAN